MSSLDALTGNLIKLISVQKKGVPHKTFDLTQLSDPHPTNS